MVTRIIRSLLKSIDKIYISNLHYFRQYINMLKLFLKRSVLYFGHSELLLRRQTPFQISLV